MEINKMPICSNCDRVRLYCEICERCTECCVCTDGLPPDIDIDDSDMLTMYGKPDGIKRLENPDHIIGMNQ